MRLFRENMFLWSITLCKMTNNRDVVEFSDEHIDFQWFKISDLSQIKIPQAYIETIEITFKEIITGTSSN